MTTTEFNIGDTVYLKAVGNNARRDKEARIAEFQIKKIGKKYLEVWKSDMEYYTVKFNMEDDFREATNYSPNWKLYFSKQEILDEEEALKITEEIRKVFNRFGRVNLSLDQLRKIKDIIG